MEVRSCVIRGSGRARREWASRRIRGRAWVGALDREGLTLSGLWAMRIGSTGCRNLEIPRGFGIFGVYSAQRRTVEPMRAHSRVSVTPLVTWEHAPLCAWASAAFASAARAIEQAVRPL
jgi:hypothetical protein